jgi:DNA-binding transcriptional LysR family regulator
MDIQARSSDVSLKNVTLRQLRAFLVASRHLNFGKAAQELDLTPQAISIQIRELEAQVGLALFERRGHGKSLRLTATGQYFLVYAQKIFSTLREAKGAISKFREVDAGHLTVGLVRTTKYIVPLLLARFQEVHPHVSVQLVQGSGEQLLQQLQVGEIDLAIVSRPLHQIAGYVQAFADYPLGFVAAPDHPMQTFAFVPRDALAQFRYIVREPGSVTRAAFDAYLHQHRIHLPNVLELPTNEAIKQAAMAGLGVGFLSLHTAGLELHSGLLCAPQVEGLPLTRQWSVARSPTRQMTPAAERFHHFILEQGDALLAAHFQALGSAHAQGVAAPLH